MVKSTVQFNETVVQIHCNSQFPSFRFALDLMRKKERSMWAFIKLSFLLLVKHPIEIILKSVQIF